MLKMQRLGLFFLLLVGLTACHPYKKQIPTGPAKKVENAYSNPGYDHSKVLNVLMLPIGNPYDMKQIKYQEKEIVHHVLRNFGKFHYFNLQTMNASSETTEDVINLETGAIDRFKLGELGKHYHAQAILKVSLQDLKTYAPLKTQVKAVLVDSQTGERIWAVDEVFDAEDSNVVNAMRIWWNTNIAGGGAIEHFEAEVISPGFFLNFVFYQVARSYAEMRVENVRAIAEEKLKLEAEQARIDKLREEIK